MYDLLFVDYESRDWSLWFRLASPCYVVGYLYIQNSDVEFIRAKAQNCSGKQNTSATVFSGFGPNPGPGRLPLDSGRGDVEIAAVFFGSKLPVFLRLAVGL